MRDQHWRSMAFHCGPCNNEFEFIVHQENGSEEQDFILRALKVADKTHIPGKYTTALKNDDEIVKYFEGISKIVIQELYRIYYQDFVYFGYDIDNFLRVSRDEDENSDFNTHRRWARVEISKKFFPYREKFHENECDERFSIDYSDEHPQ